MMTSYRCWFAVAVFVLAGCGKDPSLKATKSECDTACSHAASLNKGAPDVLTVGCPALCIDRGWTVGDVKCLSDATTYDGVQNCSVAAKVANDRGLAAGVAKYNDDKAKQIAALEELRRKEEEAKKLNAQAAKLLADLAAAKTDAERASIQKCE